MASDTPETKPPLTDEQRKDLAEVAARPDASIDTTDIPELSDEAWSAGVRGRFYRPEERQTAAGKDVDVLNSSGRRALDLGQAIHARFAALGGVDPPEATREPIRKSADFGD